jgi:predicted DNA-binding protein YlxM (UPF0122 family)
MCEKIWWQDLLEGYNRIYSKRYKTVAEMLKNLYAEQKTLEKTGDILGVSGQTVHDEMKRLNIPRLPKGHRGMPKCLRAIYNLEDTADLTYPEIAKAINFSASRVYFLLHKYGIPYQRKRKEHK